MATRLSSRSVEAAGLFDALPVAPAVPVPVSTGLLPEQAQRARLVAASVQQDITRLQHVLASPLTSWEEQGQQVIEANVVMSLTLNCLLEFVPADVRSVVSQFLELRARVVLRTYQEG